MARVKGKEARKDRDARIAAMLADGAPVDVIVEETGASRATVFRRLASLQEWPNPTALDEPPTESPADPPTPQRPPVAVDDPVAVATLAYLAGVSLLGIATAYGLDNYGLDADAPDFGLTGVDISRRRLERLAAKADALERMRLHRPAQWSRQVLEAETEERKAALDSRLPREIWLAFFSDVTSHQSNILTAHDFQSWIEWVKDLTIDRYPTMM